ncbi:POK18 protein, partial [Menura novaehollandiae]|nr:POK18 protein [Menura novaehollandiae]
PWTYLGWKITNHTTNPQTLRISAKVSNLNDVQRLVGTINWVRPLLGISNEDLHPPFT